MSTVNSSRPDDPAKFLTDHPYFKKILVHDKALTDGLEVIRSIKTPRVNSTPTNNASSDESHYLRKIADINKLLNLASSLVFHRRNLQLVNLGVLNKTSKAIGSNMLLRGPTIVSKVFSTSPNEIHGLNSGFYLKIVNWFNQEVKDKRPYFKHVDASQILKINEKLSTNFQDFNLKLTICAGILPSNELKLYTPRGTHKRKDIVSLVNVYTFFNTNHMAAEWPEFWGRNVMDAKYRKLKTYKMPKDSNNTSSVLVNLPEVVKIFRYCRYLNYHAIKAKMGINICPDSIRIEGLESSPIYKQYCNTKADSDEELQLLEKLKREEFRVVVNLSISLVQLTENPTDYESTRPLLNTKETFESQRIMANYNFKNGFQSCLPFNSPDSRCVDADKIRTISLSNSRASSHPNYKSDYLNFVSPTDHIINEINSYFHSRAHLTNSIYSISTDIERIWENLPKLLNTYFTLHRKFRYGFNAFRI